jgi:hypothetical protein
MQIARFISPAALTACSLILIPAKTHAGPLGSGFPARVCAPYVACWTDLSVTSLANATGNKYYTLAFILSNGSANSAPYWNGTIAMGDNKYVSDLAGLRAQGGDVIVSFGGQGGSELALVHKQVGTLQAAYQQVITKYNLKWLDFDIEGATIFDTAANTRRNQALKNLQAANPGLIVAYTIPSTSPDEGVTQSTLKLLQNAKANGVTVGVVNVMAMNYSTTICGDMGQYALSVAGHTRSQLASLGISASVGITPMIGVNDYACEKFTLADTREVFDYANANAYVGLLSFWVMDADAGNANLDIFKAFNGPLPINLMPTSRATAVRRKRALYDATGRAWDNGRVTASPLPHWPARYR